jgi:light-regulated signal transduction histidine kinase (bacteriophytochrome)
LQKSEISRKTNDLETAKALLENSNRELEQFAYIASHDLKEPLRMISMYVQMIQKRLKGVLEGDTEEFMGFVTDGVKRMQQMLEDLLKYSRLGKNQDYNLVDLNDILFLVQQNLKVYVKEKKAKVEVDTLPQIYGISSEINQLFQNLISNGIKFHDDARNPVVKIGMLESTHKFFTIFVKDNGIGIPADSKLRIFNLFERLHNRSDYQGTGIGLATCRKVVENLGGEIWVDSVEGEGSTFFIKLPNTVLDPPGGMD